MLWTTAQTYLPKHRNQRYKGRGEGAGSGRSASTPPHPHPLPQGGEGVNTEAARLSAGEGVNTAPGLTLTGLYNVLAALREGRPLTPKEKTIHAQGLVGVLRELHDQLDAAVLAAYGLPEGSSGDALLEPLVRLNAQRAQQEAQGQIHWLRPDFQNPQETHQNQELPALVTQAQNPDFYDEKSLSKQEQPAPTPWPATLPEQVRAVADLLAASPAPLPLAAIEARFKGRGPWKRGLPTLLSTLEALGRAQHVPQDGTSAWRA